MNKKNSLLVGAALTGLMLAAAGCASAGKSTSDAAASGGDSVVGECHGVNACKGKGDCGGPGYSCAGNNSCKGKGWVKLSKADCDAKAGKFKPN